MLFYGLLIENIYYKITVLACYHMLSCILIITNDKPSITDLVCKLQKNVSVLWSKYL